MIPQFQRISADVEGEEQLILEIMVLPPQVMELPVPLLLPVMALLLVLPLELIMVLPPQVMALLLALPLELIMVLLQVMALP